MMVMRHMRRVSLHDAALSHLFAGQSHASASMLARHLLREGQCTPSALVASHRCLFVQLRELAACRTPCTGWHGRWMPSPLFSYTGSSVKRESWRHAGPRAPAGVVAGRLPEGPRAGREAHARAAPVLRAPPPPFRPEWAPGWLRSTADGHMHQGQGLCVGFRICLLVWQLRWRVSICAAMACCVRSAHLQQPDPCAFAAPLWGATILAAHASSCHFGIAAHARQVYTVI